jgi:hypothetical protein
MTKEATTLAVVREQKQSAGLALTGQVQIGSMAEVFRLAGALAEARNFEPRAYAGDANAIAAAILTGIELGIGPMEALRSIHMIEGKPTMSAEMMLARAMRDAMDASTPTPLAYGKWHLPYLTNEELVHENACCISVARCANLSYGEPVMDVSKNMALYDRLLKKRHLSPFEHVARPMPLSGKKRGNPYHWTHRDRGGQFWSANFRGWAQFRKAVE